MIIFSEFQCQRITAGKRMTIVSYPVVINAVEHEDTLNGKKPDV